MKEWIARISLCLGILLSVRGVHGQSVEIAIEGGAAIQTIEETQAVLSSGWQVAIMPQLSVRLRYQFREVFGLRGGLQYLRKGGRVPVTSEEFPEAAAANGFLFLEGRYAALNLGVYARATPTDRVRLEGMIDVVGGFLLNGVNRNTLFPRDHPQRVIPVSNLFNDSYLALHLGGSAAFRLSDGVWIYLQPTLEAQLNNAFRSTVFVPRFVGFVPMIGFNYALD
ncbi:MAG: hypothetical protein AAGN35_02530 [Bacteroidota bacterium]